MKRAATMIAIGVALSQWLVQPVAAAASSVSYSSLTSVSCPTASFCFAVGYFVDSNQIAHPLVERWDGSAWSIVPSVGPTAAHGSLLNFVACPNPSSCEAIGANYGSPYLPFALRWDGSGWVGEAFPGGAYDSVRGLSCAAPDSCLAVGANFRYAGARGTTWRWDGTTWTRARPPALRHTVVQTVSCPSRHSCYATLSASRDHRYRIDHWNGRAWSIAYVMPQPGAYLTGISCRRDDYCTATGAVGDLALGPHRQPRPVVAMLSGRAGWRSRVLKLPTGIGNATFGPVSCATIHVCTATTVINDSLDGVAGTNSVAVRGATGPFRLAQRAYHSQEASNALAMFAGISCHADTCTLVGSAPASQGGQTDIRPGPGSSVAIFRGHGSALRDSHPVLPGP